MDTPVLSVVRGNPTDEELAALMAALLVVKPAEQHPRRVTTAARWLTAHMYAAPNSWTSA